MRLLISAVSRPRQTCRTCVASSTLDVVLRDITSHRLCSVGGGSSRQFQTRCSSTDFMRLGRAWRMPHRARPMQQHVPAYSRSFAVQRPPDQDKQLDDQIKKNVKPSPRTVDISQTIKTKLAKNSLHEDIYTLPNILTVTRLIAAPTIGYLILTDAHAWAVGLLFYAGITDLVDGWIARRWHLQTVVGTVIDPLADKALMTILTLCLAIKGGLPLWLATMILGRDISMAVAAIYYRFASLPAPRTFTRYWDFSVPSAEVHPTQISKVNTFLQLLLIGAATALPVAAPALESVFASTAVPHLTVDNAMAASQYLVAATTLWSGVSYLYTKNAVEILGDKTPAEKQRILVKGRTVLGACFLICFGVAVGLETTLQE